jgi:Ribbon-helix-helix protein, copG family
MIRRGWEGAEMSTARVYQGGRPRTQGREDDPLVTVSLHVRQSQLAMLDQLAEAEHTSRAALVREAIDRLLTRLKGPS